MGGYVLGYYFYSNKDEFLTEQLHSRVGEVTGEPMQLTRSRQQVTELHEGMPPASWVIELEPMVTFIWMRPAEGEKQAPAIIKEMEKVIEPLASELLGRLYVIAAVGNLEHLLDDFIDVNDRVYLTINNSAVIRSGLGWAKDIAYCVMEMGDTRLLLRDLPLAEMAALRGELLRRYYHDQRLTIDRERQELEEKLSAVLYSTLVPVNRSEEAGQLEGYMSELSQGYGVLTANRRVAQEGINRLRQQADQMRRYLGRGGLGLEKEVLESIVQPVYGEIKELEQLASALNYGREDYHAGLEVVRGKIDVLVSRESLNLQSNVMKLLEHSSKMQRQSLTFQVAASLIEFIILAYYGTALWKYLAPEAFHAMPGWALALTVLIFSGDAVYLTHLIAEKIQGEKHLRTRIIISAVILAAVLLLIVGLQFISGGAAAH